ncbi:MAG: restriction endonuclease subunit S [Algoriphagus sp.]|uniref:restriction endonuclease subunit S n=1 Tax=Algoriphagus sp. TaxID=1872435 RepID=UPI00260E409D|nr:restriction endonuclease subunit S [Algoriphagus sp.]MDG1276923.1 restriction endonuclease subunit S [Algoriphagus sp.]
MIIRKFTSLFKDITGGNVKVKKSEYLTYGNHPVIDQGKGLIGGYSDLNRTVNRKGEVIVFGDHTGCLKFVDFDFLLGADGVKVIQPNYDEVDTKYAYYLLHKVHIPDTGYDRKFKYLKRTEIPIPPLATQKKIAAILDAADAHRQKTKQLLAKYDELAQSIFLEMFGDPVTNPKGWEVKKMGEVLELITYGLTVRPKYHKTGVPLISAKEIRSGYLDMENAARISKTDFDSLSQKGRPNKGDILFSKTGSIGHCALVENQELFAITQNAARLVFNKSVYRKYAIYYLRSDYVQNLSKRLAKGNAVKDLQLGDMREIKFLMPPENLQSEFEEIVNSVEAQKEILNQEIISSENLFNSLLQIAFKGELVS